MTIKQLIKELEQYPKDTHVMLKDTAPETYMSTPIYDIIEIELTVFLPVVMLTLFILKIIMN